MVLMNILSINVAEFFLCCSVYNWIKMRTIHLVKKSVYIVTALRFYEINIEVTHKYTRLIFFIHIAEDCFQVCFKLTKVAVRGSINCSYDDLITFPQASLNKKKDSLKHRLLVNSNHF